MTEDRKVELGAPARQPSLGETPGDQGYVPPSDAVPLPSRGQVYPVGSPLNGADRIEIRSMTARDEDILTSRALLKQGKAVGALLRSCIPDRSVDPEQMLVGDRNAALVAIRITGYGPEYEIPVECPECDEKSDHTFDLSKLDIRPLKVAPLQPGTNQFDFVLPMSRKRVTFRLLTGADQRELSTALDRAKKAAGAGAVESSVTTSLLYSTISIDGETERSKLAQLIRDLPAGDSRKLRTYIDDISPGIDMVQKFTCKHCGHEAEVDVPIGAEFFWPST